MTFSLMTLGTIALSITKMKCNAQHNNTQYSMLSVVVVSDPVYYISLSVFILNVIMLNVVVPV